MPCAAVCPCDVLHKSRRILLDFHGRAARVKVIARTVWLMMACVRGGGGQVSKQGGTQGESSGE